MNFTSLSYDEYKDRYGVFDINSVEDILNLNTEKKRPLVSEFKIIKILTKDNERPVKLVSLNRSDYHDRKVVVVKILDNRYESFWGNEIKFHYQCQNHPNVAKIYDYFCICESSPHNSFYKRRVLYMIIEYVPGRDLSTYSIGLRLTDKQIAGIIKQCAEAINHCHSNGVIHCDVKLENIIYNNGDIKLIDFGLASNPKQSDKIYGTCFYISHELVSSGNYDYPVDIWAMGIVLYELMFGFPPFGGTKHKEVLDNILNYSYTIPINTSSSLRDLLSRMLEKNPIKRITIEEIMNHEWLKTNLK